MDILNILTTQGDKLYKEELEFFITELEVGEYSSAYIDKCKKLINELLNRNNKTSKVIVIEQENIDESATPSITISYEQLTHQTNTIVLTSEETFKKEVKIMREKNLYKENFNNYIISKKELLSVDFIEKNISFFNEWEISTLISFIQFDEDFLEKYFTVLDKTAIAKYQSFSESFFMKHFNELPVSVVLKQGVNEWKKKSKRSSKLDIFLRLKGVTY